MSRFNFIPIDASAGVNWHTNQWNNIGNAISNGFGAVGNTLDEWGSQKEHWDEIKRQRAEEARKKQLFGNTLNDVMSNVNNDKQVLNKQAERENEILNGQQGKEFDNAVEDWNLEGGELPELDDISDAEPTEMEALSAYAKYLNDPGFELALNQSQQAQDFTPLLNYMNAFDMQKYREGRDAVQDELMRNQLGIEEQAKREAGANAKMKYELENELSKLEGLKFNKNGVVAVGPYAGMNMDQLIDQVVSRYNGRMSEEELYNTLINHKTMADYAKMLSAKQSTVTGRPKPKIRFK